MTKEFIDLFSISTVLFIGWFVFHYLSLQKTNYIKNYKKISLLFFSSTVLILIPYYNKIKFLFESFTLTPLIFLLVFYCCLLFSYRLMKKYVDFTLVEKLEAKRVYFASISYRYIIYKSFDILFQQMVILCILISLKDFAIPYVVLVCFFAISFSFTHLFMLKRVSFIGMIFLGASLFGGLIFPILLNFQYGIIYAFMIHWLFYLSLGVLTHSSSKLYHSLKLAY